MIRGENIICLSSIDWDFNWQGHQEIMSTFAANGNRVLFIENTGVRAPRPSDLPRLRRRIANWFKSLKGFRKVRDGVWVFSPIILPFPFSRVCRWINRWLLLTAVRRWMRAMEFRDPIIWTFLPTGIVLDVLDGLDHKLAVYYCIADFDALVDAPKKLRRTEAEVARRCDLVFAQGPALEAKCRQWNPDVHVFPFGVKLEAFSPGRTGSARQPEELRQVARPIIGYIGGLHRHVDFPLLQRIAARQDWNLVLVGPLQAEAAALPKADNVFLLGEKPFNELAGYVEQFDVCIIPYVQSEYTRTVFPTKLNEYHALGKPVVATVLPELVAFNERYGGLVRLAGSHDEFLKEVEGALGDGDAELVRQRRSVAQEHSWTSRIEQMSALMEAAIRRRQTRAPDLFYERFVAAYRKVWKRTLLGAVIVLSVLYWAGFRTNLIWTAASPLRVAEVPRKADVIAVFAGGVGESREGGQGYEERVQKAVELYRQGMASHLIFSSGYVYRYQEPFLMKALAIQLGVPEEAIILETAAKSTYENVANTEAILKARGWNSVLLVSSPYHMRRATMVWHRTAPDREVIPVPIERGGFFVGKSFEARWRHWEAILYEYGAIINNGLRRLL